MKQTNYYLFDFMDFDSSLQKDEVLWKAYAPTCIKEKDGDIVITIPYQQQKRQEDMAPDMEVPQKSYDLIIRAYDSTILRIFTTMLHDEMLEEDDMLQMQVNRMSLHLEGTNIIDVYGKKRGTINLNAPILDYWSDLLPPPQPAPFITFYPDGDENKPIELSDDHFSPPRYDALPLGFVSCGNATTKEETNERATISFKCQSDECFVGTGERFRKMDLSGQTFQLKNQDGQGVNNRRCYKNIPFYMSSRMYGVFYHTSDYCKLSLADHSSRSVQFMCDRATIDAFLIGGKTPEEILHNYRKLTGFPSMPPLWSYGIWMSRMTYFSAEEVNDICDHLRKEHYPCDVIHLDTGWFRTDWLCEWKFNPERFPDPKGFIQNLKKKGFRVSLWQLPYVAKGAEQLEEAKANQYIAPLLKEQASEGSNFSALDYAGTIDFTYDKAVEWYKNKLLKPLLDMGVTCIKTDFGENIHLDAAYHSMTPEQLNNLYALLYQKAAFEITKEVTGDGIIWARAAWAGCQRFPLHWGGDSASSWDGMAGSLKGGLHFGLSGFAFWSHDVPGFHSIPDFMNTPINPQVYVRWTQFGVFTSHIRYHGTCKREPWHYPEIAPIIKRWWKLRYRLIPYIIQQSEMACQSGLPIVQALIFHHPNDRQCWHIDDEYYFGNEFLVCPVMNDKGIRDIYLPDGEWINFFTGERMEGGKWYDAVKTPLDLMPVFVHPNATIPIYPYDVDCTDDMDLSKAINLEITDNYIGYKL
ncbi:MAG: alpha-xylosidase [Prevotella sp.]|nr:alpha-xylosidase [Prevotella sp.]